MIYRQIAQHRSFVYICSVNYLQPFTSVDKKRGDEDRESDREQREELVKVQIHWQDALERVRQRVSLLLGPDDASRVDGERRMLRPSEVGDERFHDKGSVMQDVEPLVYAQEQLQQAKLHHEHQDVQELDVPDNGRGVREKELI